jgi:hypothetical protein
MRERIVLGTVKSRKELLALVVWGAFIKKEYDSSISKASNFYSQIHCVNSFALLFENAENYWSHK